MEWGGSSRAAPTLWSRCLVHALRMRTAPLTCKALAARPLHYGLCAVRAYCPGRKSVRLAMACVRPLNCDVPASTGTGDL